MSQTLLEPPIVEPTQPEPPVILHLRPAVELTDDDFFALCAINRDLQLERTAEGDIIIMPPTGFATGCRNLDINKQFGIWAERDGRGVAVGSSTGFKLPNGAERSPDEGWVLRSRLAMLTSEQKQKFLPLAPDFVIELKSPTDRLTDVLAKMDEYIANGVRLGWLINPETRRVHIYRPGKAIEILEAPTEVPGEPELSGFVLDLREIWQPNI
jgi:Uma2 family endonuclease